MTGRLLAAVLLAGLGPAAAAHVVNDFPTEARADYVFACMATNGQTREALSRCSCSIDVISSILTYDEYVAAEAILSIRQVGGEKTSIFSSAATAKEAVANLRRAQAEAEIRCFQ